MQKTKPFTLSPSLLPIAYGDMQEGKEMRAIARGNGSSHEPLAQTRQARLGPMKTQALKWDDLLGSQAQVETRQRRASKEGNLLGALGSLLSASSVEIIYASTSRTTFAG
jgi:hypothetical protein